MDESVVMSSLMVHIYITANVSNTHRRVKNVSKKYICHISGWVCLSVSVICRGVTVLFGSRHGAAFVSQSQKIRCSWSFGNTCMIITNDDAYTLLRKLLSTIVAPAEVLVCGPSVHCRVSNVAFHEPWQAEILPPF